MLKLKQCVMLFTMKQAIDIDRYIFSMFNFFTISYDIQIYTNKSELLTKAMFSIYVNVCGSMVPGATVPPTPGSQFFQSDIQILRNISTSCPVRLAPPTEILFQPL